MLNLCSSDPFAGVRSNSAGWEVMDLCALSTRILYPDGMSLIANIPSPIVFVFLTSKSMPSSPQFKEHQKRWPLDI